MRLTDGASPINAEENLSRDLIADFLRIWRWGWLHAGKTPNAIVGHRIVVLRFSWFTVVGSFFWRVHGYFAGKVARYLTGKYRGWSG
jgi:hypothetical protein